MKPAIKILLLALCLLIILPAQAQFLDRLQKRAEKKIEDRALQKADKGIDKGLDKTEEVISDGISNDKKSTPKSTDEASDSDREAQEQMMRLLGGNASNAKVADIYSFNSSIAYDMASDNGKKSTSMEYTMLLNPAENYIGTRMGNMESDGKKTQAPTNMTTIMDYGNDAMVIIMQEQNMAQIMSLDNINKMVQSDEPQTETKVEKTGKTKDILGYNCEEYLITSDNTKGSIWITPELEALNKSFFKSLGNANLANKHALQDMKGMMMEMDMTMEDEKGKPMHMTMKAKSIKKESSSFTMANYQTINLGGMSKN